MLGEKGQRELPAGRSSQAEALYNRIQKSHPFPLSITMTVTERCNLTCKHCYVSRGAVQDELDLIDFEPILDDLADCGVLFLCITGGEPAIRMDLEQIVESACRRHFNVRLKTNGTMLSNERIDRLVEFGLSAVDVSLYHDNPSKHDLFVGKAGAFEKAMHTLEYFQSAGLRARVSTTVMSWNADRISSIMDICEEKGLEYQHDPGLTSRNDGDRMPLQFELDEGHLVDILSSDQRLLDKEAFSQRAHRKPEETLCGMAQTVAHVCANGDVTPCVRLPMVLGNMLEQSFREIWTESDVRKKLLAAKWGDLKKCADCFISWACSRCPGSAWIDHGDILAHGDEYCRLARVMSKAALKESQSKV